MWRALRMAAVVVAAVAINNGIATADTIQSFTISGTGSTEADGPFSFTGNMSIDITDETLLGGLNLSIGDYSCAAPPCQPDTFTVEMQIATPGFVFATAVITLIPDTAGDGLFSGGSVVGGGIYIGTTAASTCEENPAPCNAEITGFSGELSPVTPLPTALPLFATGLAAMGLFGWRRKRKNAAEQAFFGGTRPEVAQYLRGIVSRAGEQRTVGREPLTAAGVPDA